MYRYIYCIIKSISDTNTRYIDDSIIAGPFGVKNDCFPLFSNSYIFNNFNNLLLMDHKLLEGITVRAQV